jgi:flagellar capping protein FliD
VLVSKGIGSRITDYITQITQENGAISARKASFEAKENSMEEQINIIQARIDKKRDRLVTRFINLETAISGFKSQESFLNSMLAQIKANSLYMGNNN